MNEISDLFFNLLLAAAAIAGLVALLLMIAGATLWLVGAETEIDDNGTPLVIRGRLAVA